MIQVAALWELSAIRDVIGILGSSSVGKDNLLKHAFDMKQETSGALPGLTSRVEVHDLATSPVRVLNFPGFGDVPEDVRRVTSQQIRNSSLAIYMIDISRPVDQEEIKRFEEVKSSVPT